MKIALFLGVLGAALIIEARFILKKTSTSQRAAIHSDRFARAAARGHANKLERFSYGQFGGLGGLLYGALCPYIGMLMGGLFVFGAFLFGIGSFFGWPPEPRTSNSTNAVADTGSDSTSEKVSYCGDAEHPPQVDNLVGNWIDYKCMNKKAAGVAWSYCIARKVYSDTAGTGCNGANLCCPLPRNVDALKTDGKIEKETPTAVTAPEVPLKNGEFDATKRNPGTNEESPIDAYLKTGAKN